MSELVYKRKLTTDRRGHYRLSVPPEIATALGCGPLGLIWKGGYLVVATWPMEAPSV